MLKDVDIARMVSQLSHNAMAQVAICGNDVLVRSFDNSSKIALSTTVYSGSAYIPHKVRDSITQKAPFAELPIRTYLSIDEQNYRILLHYVGRFEELESSDFAPLMQDFVDTANQWREFLEEQDRDDRVYIYKAR